MKSHQGAAFADTGGDPPLDEPFPAPAASASRRLDVRPDAALPRRLLCWRMLDWEAPTGGYPLTSASATTSRRQ